MLGALSDRYGRKPVLTVSVSIAVAAYVLISLGIELRSLALIAIGCLIGDLAESNIAIAQSAISDVASPDERPRLFAWIYSCCSLGYIAGPVIGGQLVVLLGWSALFWLTTPLLGVTLGWIWISFREMHPPEQDRRFDAFTALTNLAGLLTDRPIRRLYLINFLIYLGLFGYFRMVLVYMVYYWHTTIDQTTLIYSGLALISAVASFGIHGAAYTTIRPEPDRGRLGDLGGRGHDIDNVSCTTRLDLDYRRAGNSHRNTGSRGVPDGALERCFRRAARPRHGNNQALQVGAESAERSNRRRVGGDTDPVATRCLRRSIDWSGPRTRIQHLFTPGSFPTRAGPSANLINFAIGRRLPPPFAVLFIPRVDHRPRGNRCRRSSLRVTWRIG